MKKFLLQIRLKTQVTKKDRKSKIEVFDLSNSVFTVSCDFDLRRSLFELVLLQYLLVLLRFILLEVGEKFAALGNFAE